MRPTLHLIAGFLIFLTSCHLGQSDSSGFEYDPTVPYPTLLPGDFWPDKFDQRGLQNAVIFRDRLYCNTIDVSGDSNFLYCLDPKNGLVVWRAPIEAFATQPAFVINDTVIYCSYLGDMFAFDNKGKMIWQNKFDLPYGGHWVDTIGSKLLMKTVYWKYVSTYDIKSGERISKIENDSLRNQIDIKIKSGYPRKQHTYRFERKGKFYRLRCGMNEMEKYEIEITTEEGL